MGFMDLRSSCSMRGRGRRELKNIWIQKNSGWNILSSQNIEEEISTYLERFDDIKDDNRTKRRCCSLYFSPRQPSSFQ